MSDAPTKLLLGLSGFMETEKRESGIEDILWKVFSDVDHCATARFIWNDSLVTMERLLKRIKNEWPKIKVSIVSYSYGGTTATRLTERLKPMRIENLFLIDPVWRPFRNMPSIFSIYGAGTLTVSSNVGRCKTWRQEMTVIRGCKIKLEGSWTKYSEDTLNFKHTKIDNSTLIRGAIVERMKDDT